MQWSRSRFCIERLGFRGVSSVESAGLGGSAHLVNLLWSDTCLRISIAKDIMTPKEFMGCRPQPKFNYDIEGRCRWKRILKMSLTHIQMGSFHVSVIHTTFLMPLASFGVGNLKDKYSNAMEHCVIRPDSGDPVNHPIKGLWHFVWPIWIHDKRKRVPSITQTSKGDFREMELTTSRFSRIYAALKDDESLLRT